MCNEIIQTIYRIFLESGGRKIFWIERSVGLDESKVVSVDDKRNEPELYSNLFSGECRENMEELYMAMLKQMRETPFEHCDDLMEAAAFLQQVMATAMWKYHQDIGEAMEKFTREFDRLDVSAERVRLHEYTKLN